MTQRYPSPFGNDTTRSRVDILQLYLIAHFLLYFFFMVHALEPPPFVAGDHYEDSVLVKWIYGDRICAYVPPDLCEEAKRISPIYAGDGPRGRRYCATYETIKGHIY